MVQFTNLRLSGFKSFVDPTDLVIEPGLTGVVGPNGCGKSNLVEAIRWVMGENSAKRMRGGEMDDVIFSGTASRPSRNLADVVMVLDNKDRSAPAQFNDSEQIEISRRINRGHGSTYRVNGKEVRARDVQLLFADVASGPHSTAMVSQGRVGALINAKPTQRRGLLEEAAGITGLHSRRHEAELRLRAAETNLERLDDVVITLEAQLQGLKKQARQATRYKNVNTQIRRLEAIALHLEALAIRQARIDAETAFAESERLVGEVSGKSAEAARMQADIASRLPALRQREAEVAAALQRLLIDRDALQRDAERAETQMSQVRERLAQIGADRGRVNRMQEDAVEAESRLAAERKRLQDAEEAEKDQRSEAKADLDRARSEVEAKETELSALSQQVAGDDAKANALTRQIQSVSTRIERLKNDLARANEERGRLEASRPPQDQKTSVENAIARGEDNLTNAGAEAEDAGERLTKAREIEETAREALREQSQEYGRIKAEVEALAALLEADKSDDWPPIVDALNVKAGYETALGAALGDDLSASSDAAAPVHWGDLPDIKDSPSLPEGAEPLSRWVKGPKALSRRMAQIGVVSDQSKAAELQPLLKTGQRLITRDGGLWRWDGFTAGAGAPTAEALRLEQRNRLAELREILEGMSEAHTKAEEVHAKAKSEADEAQSSERTAREKVNRAYGELDHARRKLSEEMQKVSALNSRIAGLEESAQRLSDDLGESEQALAAAQSEWNALPPLEEAKRTLQMLREELQRKRTTLSANQERLSGLEREALNRGHRLLSIGAEAGSWAKRAGEAEQHLEELGAREKTVSEELALLESVPGEIGEKREKLAELIEEAEAKRKTAADELAEAENLQAEADRAYKVVETAVQSAREDRVRAQAQVEHACENVEQLNHRIMEKLDCVADTVLESAGIEPGEELPARDDAEIKLAKLVRERENIGPVNLRAEIEAQELDEQIVGLQDERRDLVSAIARLRQGIGSLNREGRERLLAAFEAVNAHFTELFVRLFGGGRAHLSLTESDDPLEAGLEIMASPPGKRLQVMSLLSGGEQALTALALLFAVFLTNPAPICVLDEVDAPLDDANVDRLCTLLDEMVATTSTRFLMITHHRMTMARADRLFGVTMAERGVSQLVSVDYAAAAKLRETA